MLFVKFVYYLVQSIPVTLEVVFSGGSRPSDNGGGGGKGGLGGGHPDPEIRGRTRSPKKFFSVLRASFWSTNKGWGGAGPSPGSATSFIFLPCLLSCALFPKLPFMTIGHFLVSPGLCIKTRLGAQPLIWKLFFILMQMKPMHFHKKGCALGLILKVRVFWNSEEAY